MISGLMNMEHYLGPYRLSTLGRCKRNVGSIKSRYGGKTNPKKKAKVYLESTVLKESLNPKHRRASQRHFELENVESRELKITGGEMHGILETKMGAELYRRRTLKHWFAEGMHVVPPPMTGNYMPTGPEIEIDYSQFTYGPKQTQPSESESQSSECDTCESNISAEPYELVSEPVVSKSNVESQPKVWSDAPIIEEYESDSEDECVDIPIKQ
ncbi:hypothetical protein Tco_0776705 [Tanacetum coccineum]